MRIFEFQFNPKARSDRFFRVFSFHAPQEMLDRGDMYIIGELKNALPINSGLLDQLAALLSKEYYAPEKSNQNASHRLKNALKEGNNFLAEETKKGNVDWLGNLHLLVLLFVPASQGYTLYFTKVGGMKLWLSRSGSLVDATKSVDLKKADEGSAKIFGNVGSGRVVPQDRLVALTQELFAFFSRENFLQQITQLKEEKQFKNIFKTKEKEMSLLSGVLLFVLVEAVQASAESGPSSASWRIRASKLGLRVPSLGVLPKIKLPIMSLPRSITLRGLPTLVASISSAKKRMGILLLFGAVLLVGFAIFGAEQKEKEDAQKEVLKQEEMEEQDRIANKIIDIAALQVVVEFNESFVAENFQRVSQIGEKWYFFGSSSKNISLFDSKTQTLESIAQSSLANFPEDFQLAGMEQFGGSLYFLDSRTGEILKSSESWLDPLSSKKPINAHSLSIDGNIWILVAGNEISRYHKGRYQETLHSTISPALRSAISLKTGAQLSYLYMLDPAEKRLVVIDKSGMLIQQYRSEAFVQARDFVISPDAKTIYLFDGAKLYRIELL